MLYTYDIVKEIIPEYNIIPVSSERAFSIIEQKRIDFSERKMRKEGYHVWLEGEDYIFIKKTLTGLKWLEAVLHELIHALTSIPLRFMRDKQQIEAKALALIALIPQPLLADKYRFLEENPTKYARKLWNEREKVYFLYGV